MAEAEDIFFFSSRRRHTRLQGDWSSDVCSSDLGLVASVPLGVDPDSTIFGNADYGNVKGAEVIAERPLRDGWGVDRKSTRLNSSHLVISYAVFCLKKKKNNNIIE